jgi:hypothetical protein
VADTLRLSRERPEERLKNSRKFKESDLEPFLVPGPVSSRATSSTRWEGAVVYPAECKNAGHLCVSGVEARSYGTYFGAVSLGRPKQPRI